MCAVMPATLIIGPKPVPTGGPMPMCFLISDAWKLGMTEAMAEIHSGVVRMVPLHITRGPRDNPLHAAFVGAAQQAGYPVTNDYNGEQQEGFGPMEMTVWKGQRWSAANAYLKPALRRDNCTLIRALARKVVVSEGRAVGVEVERGGTVEVITARREVILAASSINSPKLLMLSGIGPAAHLESHGIDIVADRPGVGQNLQDHLEVYFQLAAQQPVTLYRYWKPVGQGDGRGSVVIYAHRTWGIQPV